MSQCTVVSAQPPLCLSYVSMDGLEVASWQDLFAKHSVNEVRAFCRTLDARRQEHGKKVREAVGSNHSQIVSLTNQIARVKVEALANERELAELSSTKHDIEWERYLKNLDRYNWAAQAGNVRSCSRQLAARLLRFASDSLINRHYLATARALYFVTELSSEPDVAKRADEQHRKLSAIVNNWLDNGINDGMSQELFNTCLIINSVSPKKMVVDFLNRRKDHIASDLQRQTPASVLQTLDLIESTLFVANQLVDHLFKTKLSKSRLINSPEFNDADLRLGELDRWLDKNIFELPAFPENCYFSDKNVDIELARSRFMKDTTALLKVSAGPTASCLDIAEITSLYCDILVKSRDSTELGDLGDIMGGAFHDELVSQFEVKALARFSRLDSLVVPLPAKPSKRPEHGFTKSVADLLNDIENAVEGQVDIAAEPLKAIQEWAQGSNQVDREAKKLQHAGVLSRDAQHRQRLDDFVAALNEKINAARSDCYKDTVERLGKLEAHTASDFALVLLVKHKLDARVAELGMEVQRDLDTTLDQQLAKSLIDNWELEPEADQLEGLEISSGILNSLFELVKTMDATLCEFEWPQSTLAVLRSLILAKVESTADAAALESLLSGQGKLAERFRCILGPLIPETQI